MNTYKMEVSFRKQKVYTIVQINSLIVLIISIMLSCYLYSIEEMTKKYAIIILLITIFALFQFVFSTYKHHKWENELIKRQNELITKIVKK